MSSEHLGKKPVVFNYQDYRAFLRDLFAFEKAHSEKFSYRVFSARAGFKSPNFLKLVIEGQRNLTDDSVRRVSMAFKLTAPEHEFFRGLVVLNQAESPTERSLAARNLYKSKVFREMYPLKVAQLEFYENWWSIPLREMIGSPAFREDPQWIARKLRNRVTPQQVIQSIETLLAIGLIRRDDSGRLVQAQQNVTTGDEVASSGVAAFHKQMIELAGDSIDSVKRYRREVSSSTVLVSESTFARLKELIQIFRKTLIAEAESGMPADQTVYQINFQLFPLTETLADDDGDPSEQKGEVKCKKAS